LETGSRPTNRLVRLMQSAVRECALDLSGATVLTEAASGAYVVTPVLAALAGAQVNAFTRSTRYGSLADVESETIALAQAAGVADRIKVWSELTSAMISAADIVTNSGHLRPLDARFVASMKARSVISLMYEVWELRPEDVDLAAAEQRGIPFAGTNERHPALDVFSYLGPLAVSLLHDSRLPVYRNSILLLCDNDFAPFIEKGLLGAGAEVTLAADLRTVKSATYDAVLVAIHPRPGSELGPEHAAAIAQIAPGAVVAQFWGDIDRQAFAGAGLVVSPSAVPKPGHMGVLLSDLGPDPIVRLQTGGLKVGEFLWRARVAGMNAAQAVARAVESGFGQAVPAYVTERGTAHA
jgi:hypothetical protein